jgi:taurine---2-oxoglutarate transaminase
MTIDPTTTPGFINDRKHVFHSWSAQGTLNPVEIVSGKGSYFTDASGKKYLDFSSQLVNLNIGHQHPKLIAAIQEQAARLCTIAPAFANDARSEAARLITEVAPGDLNMVFFTNGGAEAAENAVRMSKLAHRSSQNFDHVPFVPRFNCRRDCAYW